MTHWTYSEDARLLQAVQEHPTLTMSELQMRSFPYRTAEAVRHRHDRLTKKKFTRAEDILICTLLHTGHEDINGKYHRFFGTRHCARDVRARARLLRNTDVTLQTSQEVLATLIVHDRAALTRV